MVRGAHPTQIYAKFSLLREGWEPNELLKKEDLWPAYLPTIKASNAEAMLAHFCLFALLIVEIILRPNQRQKLFLTHYLNAQFFRFGELRASFITCQ